MSSVLGRLLAALRLGSSPSAPALEGFFDSLIQAFENCRCGLTEERLAGGTAGIEHFFLDLYEKEIPRLADTIRLTEPLLSEEARAAFLTRVNDYVKSVLIPAYAERASVFTRKERNDFYLAPNPFHPLERVGWCAAGVTVGALVVVAPFIPLWEKEWILPFAATGLFLPDLRRLYAFSRYQRALNSLVGAADAEINRIDTAYLSASEPSAIATPVNRQAAANALREKAG
ncbi:MAG TPA: hypothetical protein VGR00_07845 [Thermoanaerobaculia bacterium]|nr:hypothetical protein [Thermoanaerobaculia bacterium]